MSSRYSFLRDLSKWRLCRHVDCRRAWAPTSGAPTRTVKKHSVIWLLASVTFAVTLAAAPAPTADEAAALELFAAKDPGARAAFEALATRDPQNTVAAFHLGALARQRKDLTEAVTQLEKATKLDPLNVSYQLELGYAYGESGAGKNPIEAIVLGRKSKACYDRALELDPDDFTVHLVLLNYYRDVPPLVGGSPAKARHHAAELCRIDPARGLEHLVELAINQKEFTDAWATLEQFHREHPDAKPALFQLGRIASLSGRNLDRAATYLAEYLNYTPTAGEPTLAQAHWRLGVIRHRQGDLAAARAEYQAALDLDPSSEQARASLQSLE